MKEIHLITTSQNVFRDSLEERSILNLPAHYFRIDSQTMKHIIKNAPKVNALFVRQNNFPLTRLACSRRSIPFLETPLDDPKRVYERITQYSQDHETGIWLYPGKQEISQHLGQLFSLNDYNMQIIDLDQI